MAYFLKKSTNKKGVYLQIYESFWDPSRKQTVHKSIKPIGYVDELMQNGIDDPISYYKEQIDQMNTERKNALGKERAKKIGKQTPERYLGPTLLTSLLRTLDVASDLSYLQLCAGFNFSLSSILFDLISARLVNPCSKRSSYLDVIPKLVNTKCDYSLDQLYGAIEFLGREYKKVIEIFNAHAARLWTPDTARTYFDCTNFFFEIDKEDALRRKGPSKEHRTDPIVGMGLLLDKNCMPLGMSIYPGNELEKPQMREVIGDLKRRGSICGRTIRVADKGLNCADNIADALLAKDGYIFSKSPKMLPEIEQMWLFAEEGWEEIKDVSGHVLYKIKSTIGEFSYRITTSNKRKKPVNLKEKRVASWNPKLARKQLGEIDRMVEKARSLRLSGAKKCEYGESAKFVTFKGVDNDGQETEVVASINWEAINRAKAFAGYNLLVTSETSMSDKEIYEAYRGLWRIEESFRAMKSQLVARPVYLQKPDSIAGHFLICYLAVFLERILQIRVLKDEFGTEEIGKLIKEMRVVAISHRRYINITRSSKLIERLEKMTGLPFTNYYLNASDVEKMTKYVMPKELISQPNKKP